MPRRCAQWRSMRTRERLDAAQHQGAVERPGHRADRVLQEAQPLGDARRRSWRRTPPTTSEWPPRYFVVECTTMSAPSVERLLQVRAWRTCCRRRRARPPACAIAATASMSTILSSGLVGVSIQTSVGRLGWSAASTTRQVGQVDVREAVALRLEHLREEPVGAAVDVVQRDDVFARARGARARSPSRSCRTRTRCRGRPPRATARHRSSAVRVGLVDARVVVAAAHAVDAVLGVRRRLVDRHVDGRR